MLSPDGQKVAVVRDSAGVEVWSTQRHRRLFSLKDARQSAVFSRDGRILATSGPNDKILLWDARSGRSLGKPLSGPAGAFPVAFNPSGTFLATEAADGGVLLWDVDSHTQIGTHLQPPASGLALFSPDGTHLAILSETGQGYVWDVDPAHWEVRACQVAGRNLSRSEWNEFLPDRPYQRVCPELAQTR